MGRCGEGWPQRPRAEPWHSTAAASSQQGSARSQLGPFKHGSLSMRGAGSLSPCACSLERFRNLLRSREKDKQRGVIHRSCWTMGMPSNRAHLDISR